MIVTKIDEVYEVTLPADLRRILSGFNFAFSIGLTSSSDVLTCLGARGYASQLYFWIVFPFVLLGCLLAGTAGYILWRQQQPSTRKAAGDHGGRAGGAGGAVGKAESALTFARLLLVTALPAILRGSFLVYPLMANVAFSAFSCYDFRPPYAERTRAETDDGFTALIADVRVNCTMGGEVTSEWGTLRDVAWATVLLHPFGPMVLILINSAFLLKSRHAILSGVHTPLTRAIEFLYKEYEPSFYGWEIVRHECR